MGQAEFLIIVGFLALILGWVVPSKVLKWALLIVAIASFVTAAIMGPSIGKVDGVKETTNIRNQNPTGCAYGDSIPVDSEKCSAENFSDKPSPKVEVLPEVGGSGK